MVAKDEVLEDAAAGGGAALCGLRTVAENGVVACHQAIAHRRGRGLQCRAIGRDRPVDRGCRAPIDRVYSQGPRKDVHIDARVAVDMVGAAIAVDLIVAGATSQMVACLGAKDLVIARATIGCEAYARQIGIGQARE